MAEPGVPGRLRWAVELLEVAPDDQLLEIGPGPGVSVALVCERLTGGRITAIDRSATAIERATRRNADHVAAGRAAFEQLDLADTELVRRALAGRRFDKAFAVDVNLFWVRPADAELALLKDLLRPGGALHLVYDPPGTGQADRITGAVTAALAGHGFATEVRAGAGGLLAVLGRR